MGKSVAKPNVKTKDLKAGFEDALDKDGAHIVLMWLTTIAAHNMEMDMIFGSGNGKGHTEPSPDGWMRIALAFDKKIRDYMDKKIAEKGGEQSA